MKPLLTIPLIVASGVLAGRAKVATDAPRVVPAAPAAVAADSASICWQRFSRGVPVEESCTGLTVAPRVDTIQIPVPLPGVVTQRFPVGPYELFESWERPADSGFTGAVLYTNPRNVLRTLRGLRASKVRAFLKLTGEPHSDPIGTDAYRTNGKFDLQKWQDSTAQYLPVRDSLAQAVSDGWVLGYSMIDEPNHPTWGDALTKATLDSMAAFSKSLFPGLPTGAAVPYGWKADQTYRVLDFIIAQTWKPTITPDSFRTAAVAAARKNGVALVLSINLMGMPVLGDCERRGNRPECYMTPDQVRLWGMTFGAEPYACGLTMWRYDRLLWSRPVYRRAIQDVAALVSQRRAKPCRRN